MLLHFILVSFQVVSLDLYFERTIASLLFQLLLAFRVAVQM